MKLIPCSMSAGKSAVTFLLLLAIGVVVYGRSIGNNFVTWDDPGLILDNQNIREITPASLRAVFTTYDPELYIPLTFVSYQANYALFGLNPEAYHATDLALHIINAFLATLLLGTLLGSELIGICLGILFLIHPLNTEAVVWASARKDVLSASFFLLSLLWYVEYRQSATKESYGASLAMFLFALFSKVIAVTLPVHLLLVDWLEGRKIDRNSVKEKLPFFALSVLFGVVALFGKTEVLATTTLWQKLLMAGRSTVFYLQTFVWPARLSFAYPYNGVISLADIAITLSCIVALSLATFLWIYRRTLAPVSFAFAFYFLTLVPTFTNFAKGGDVYIASDRYAYLPMIGLLFFVGYVAERYLSSAATHKNSVSRRNVMIVMFAVACVLFGRTSILRAFEWRDSASLYQSAIDAYPQTRAAHHNLGMEFLRSGDAEKAVSEFDTALAIKEDYRTRMNKGAALIQMGKLDDAEKEYERAKELNQEDPEIDYGFGNLAYKRKEYTEAALHYSRALEKQPDYTNALNNLGGLYLELRQWDSAIDILRQTIEYHPDFAEAHYNLGGAYEAKGMTEEAIAEYVSSLALNPSDTDAMAHLATLYYERGSIDAAAKTLQDLLTENPYDKRALDLVSRMKRDGYAE